MRNELLIYIGDELLDVYPNTAIGVSLQIADIDDLSSRNVSYTNQFEVPFTANNDRIYQHSRDIRSTTRIPYTKQLVKIVQNGIEVITNGIHTLKKANEGYELYILFREYGFFKAIEGRKLWGLSGFKEKFNDPRAYRNTTSGLIYPVVNPGTVGTSTDLVKIPFWYYSEIIDQIFVDAGYAKTGLIFDNDKYKKMIVNVSGSVAGYNAGFISKRTINVFIETTQIIAIGDGLPHDINFTGVINGGNDPEGYWDGTSKYLTNDPDIPNGQVVFDANVRFNISFTGNGGQDIRVSLVSGASTVIDVIDLLAIGAGGQTASLDFTGDNPSALSFPYQLNGTGNGLKIVIQRINGTAGNINVVGGNMQIFPLAKPSSFFSGPLSAEPYAYYADLLPDMTQSEFLKDFMIRFGLLFSESLGSVDFQGYNQILASTEGKDFTSKRVKNKKDDLSFNPLTYAMNNIFDYTSGDNLTKTLDASGNIVIDNENISATKTIFKSPVLKSATIVVNNILCAVVPIVTSDPTENFNWWNDDAGLRLLLVRDKYSFEPNYPGPGASTPLYKIAYFDDDNQDYTMIFQQFIDDHYTLLTQILQNAKLLKREYNLNEIDIASFNFLKPIFDTDSFFLVNKVGPFLPGTVTEMEILKI